MLLVQEENEVNGWESRNEDEDMKKWRKEKKKNKNAYLV